MDIIRAVSFPEKYKETLPIDRIVAEKKVDEEGVLHYRDKLENGYVTKPLIVLKHPKEEIYAVLDGHHRFEAMRSVGLEEVPAVVVDAYVEPVFIMTKKGYFQPTPAITKYVRIPFWKFVAYMRQFLDDPWQMLSKD
ncbi:MAG: ParB N-terminal domain-containing protein [Thermoplasmata archaeon]|nr:ParB N-terminal domain-containing protein [Thermoplasmata archaeon]